MFGRLIAGETIPAARGSEALRLDVQMQYSVRAGGGTAAIRWTDSHQGGQPAQAVLVALLYGRILCIHRETRKELFRRVDDLARQNVETEGQAGFGFTPWTLHVGFGGGDHELWPWYLVRPDILPEARTYTAILKAGEPCGEAPAGQWLQLEMSRGLERVLIPSVALISITALSQTCDQETRYLLGLLLWQMNAYWGSPDRVSLGSEAVAYAAALTALRGSQLRAPAIASPSAPESVESNQSHSGPLEFVLTVRDALAYPALREMAEDPSTHQGDDRAQPRSTAGAIRIRNAQEGALSAVRVPLVGQRGACLSAAAQGPRLVALHRRRLP